MFKFNYFIITALKLFYDNVQELLFYMIKGLDMFCRVINSKARVELGDNANIRVHHDFRQRAAKAKKKYSWIPGCQSWMTFPDSNLALEKISRYFPAQNHFGILGGL